MSPETTPQKRRRSWAEPYRIKMVEPVRELDPASRRTALDRAGWNTFLLRSDEVYIDLLTDSGTSAMSAEQWAAMMLGDEAYAGSVSFFRLQEAVGEVYGYTFLVPTHQGRGAEHLISKLLVRPGHIIPGNMYFTTTRLHQELQGGTFVDVIIDEAHDAQSPHPFKGNIDLQKLRRVIEKYGKERIPYVSVALTVNMAGGQPVSLENLRAVRALCADHKIPVYLDKTRIAENAYFIKQREPGQAERSLRQIILDLCVCSDGAWMSSKKDHLVNIGGYLALREQALYDEAINLAVVYEGLHTYGGMSGRDMEAVARGIHESVDLAHMRARIGQVLYLGDKLREAGVPIVEPVGGHAVFLDAKRFLPHVPQDQFPAQRLAGELYLSAGVRAMERGIVSAGRNKEGEHNRPALELVRLTIPRRVYTQTHMDVVAEAVAELWERRAQIRGLELTYEPKYLRFFQARFRPL